MTSETPENAATAMGEIAEMDGYRLSRCQWCGKPFLPAKGRAGIQRFCSPGCRKNYFRHQDKDTQKRAAGLERDNDQLRDTIARQEETIEYESTERRRTEQRVSSLERIIRTLADDLNELMGAGVLVIDRSSPSVGLLNQHDHFLRIMEDWSSRNRSTIERQRDDIEQVKQRWREERAKAIAGHRPADWIRDLDREYQTRLNGLMRSHRQYATYLALEDMKDDHRQETGAELPWDGTEAEPLRNELQDFANSKDKERTINHDINQ